MDDEEKYRLSCSSHIGDVLIIGEQLRIQIHSDLSQMIKDRRRHLRWYACCFVGSDVVDWLIRTDQAPDRRIATGLMQILAENHIFHHVNDSQLFKDDSHLYRFRKDDGTFSLHEDTLVFLRGQKLCHRMFSTNGLLKPHEKEGVTYDNSFVGGEAVSWMAESEAVSQDDARQQFRVLLESDIIRHVTGSHHFKDEDLLYQFRTDFGRPRVLLDLILPLPQPQFGGAVEQTLAAASPSPTSAPTQTTPTNTSIAPICGASPTSTATDIPSASSRLGAHRTESGYHSDQREMQDNGSMCSGSSHEGPGSYDSMNSFNHSFSLNTALIRRATIPELQASDSLFVKKDLRIAPDPVGYGFVIRGEGPVFVKTVDPTGPAAAAGLRVGHYIYSVNDAVVLEKNHRDLAHIILDSRGYVSLVIMEHIHDCRVR